MCPPCWLGSSCGAAPERIACLQPQHIPGSLLGPLVLACFLLPLGLRRPSVLRLNHLRLPNSWAPAADGQSRLKPSVTVAFGGELPLCQAPCCLLPTPFTRAGRFPLRSRTCGCKGLGSSVGPPRAATEATFGRRHATPTHTLGRCPYWFPARPWWDRSCGRGLACDGPCALGGAGSGEPLPLGGGGDKWREDRMWPAALLDRTGLPAAAKMGQSRWVGLRREVGGLRSGGQGLACPGLRERAPRSQTCRGNFPSVRLG